MKIETSELVNDFRRVCEQIDKAPTKKEYFTYGKYGVNTIQGRWGTWNKALKEVFNSVNQECGESVEKTCSNCGKTLVVIASAISDHNFCNQSCAAVFNNVAHPKREKTNTCSCGTKIFSDHKYCPECIADGKHLNGGRRFSSRTIKQVAKRSKKAASKYAQIRQDARAVMKKAKIDDKCAACGYQLSTQVCHIRPISDFEEDTLVSEVNRVENLVYLCRNHHWELDHGYLEKSW